MTRRVVYSPEARQQLTDLYSWIATQSGFPDRAEAFVSAILDYCDGSPASRWSDVPGMTCDPDCARSATAGGRPVVDHHGTMSPMTTLSDDEIAVQAVGRAVRAGRKRLGLSVQQFADRAEVSLGLVSTLERGQGNPSLHTLRRLAGVLGVPVGELLEPALEDVTIIRADQRHQLPIPDAPEEQRVVRELLTPRGDTRLQVIRSTLPVGFSNEAHPFRHLATESVTVETGRLLLVHGDRREELGPGDSATYGCETPHWWANLAGVPTIVIGAVTAAER